MNFIRLPNGAWMAVTRYPNSKLYRITQNQTISRNSIGRYECKWENATLLTCTLKEMKQQLQALHQEKN